MVEGLMKRYADAGIPPPDLIYVDRDCCSASGPCKVKQMFHEWTDLLVRLDIWHFMRPLASCVYTEAHPLYSVFLSRLSSAIFEWSAVDLALLRTAKRGELEEQGVRANLSDAEIDRRITRQELARHCRRRTRGVDATRRDIQALLEELCGPNGKDTLGVPLLNPEATWKTWEIEKKHLACIQDPAFVSLYTEVGTITKGGVQLPVVRCARGSTSLESFHLHVNKFIPGSSASAAHFQAYLLEGLYRWNEDRARAATPDGIPHMRSFCAVEDHVLKDLHMQVYGSVFDESLQTPAKYIGELIGVDYLFDQTGKDLDRLDQLDDVDDPEVAMTEPATNLEEDQDFVDDTVRELPPVPQVERHPVSSPAQSVIRESSAGSLESDATFTAPTTGVELQGTDGDNRSLPNPDVVVLSRPEPKNAPGPSSVSTGPDSIPGYEKVCQLVSLLVDLRSDLSVSDETAQTIVQAFNQLDEYDRNKINYTPRHRDRVLGRFRRSKGEKVEAGVDSTKRSFLHGTAACSPGVSRMVSALVEELLLRHPVPKRIEGSLIARYTMVLRDYNTIKKVVEANAIIKFGCSLQLPSLSQKTISIWHIAKEKESEKHTLTRGTSLTPQIRVQESDQPFAPRVSRALDIQEQNQSVTAVAVEHGYHRPADTSDMGRRRNVAAGRVLQGDQKATYSDDAVPQPSASYYERLPPSRPIIQSTNPRSLLVINHQIGQSRQADWYRRKRQEKEAEVGVPAKRRKLSSTYNCKKCMLPLTRENGHLRRTGLGVYCPFKDSDERKALFLAPKRE